MRQSNAGSILVKSAKARSFFAQICVVAGIAGVTSFASAAAWASSSQLQLSINGQPIINETDIYPDGAARAASRNVTTNSYRSTLETFVAPAFAGGTASLATASSGEARVKAITNSDFRLKRPQGADVAGGRLVIYVRLDGEIVGTATIDLKAGMEVTTLQTDPVRGETTRSVADQPGGDSTEFAVTTVLPGNLPTAGLITTTITLELTGVASLSSGSSLQIAVADAREAKVVGFRVFNSAGTQVPGFTLTGGRAIPELGLPPAGQAVAVEYYHAGFRHYFLTANATEIANLDSGVTPGWQRTQYEFNVHTAPGVNLVPVCRFFSGTNFAPKSSHFYAPRGLGCEALLPSNPVWSYEGEVFYTALPDVDGSCPDGSVPVYRVFNDGQGGAPNHRFTTSQAVQADMLVAGYVAEGRGPGVGMCSPH